ncbi:hypothetical protein [Cryptosporangium aurantiacum]|uniref:Mannosyltransferase related to Gpi18 n=1 Tax=Cryptosporangium aurantiacum TaxID=134849 RepID=A0A1M7Q8R7_9ACTN|nr:hypothetical protein [Cryptosporangium aurantiacum]SHN26682.1 Mannosyltransferase related to Gpi18 [Cryptosporangium aurantiacum]
MSWVRDRIARARTVPPAEWLLLGGLVTLALLIRYACRSYYTSDLVVFGEWYDQLQAAGGVRGLREPIGNYNAPFLYLLVIAGWLPGATLMKIKLILVAFDVLLVFFVHRLVALRWPGWRIPAVAALTAAFLPTVVINASMYGQCDSIWAAFCLGGVYFLLRDREWMAVAFFATAYAFKPQAVFIFPLLMLAVLGGRVRWRALLALPVVYVALDLPALLLGRDPVELLGLYAGQLDEPSALRRGAPSVYQYLQVTVGQGVLKNLGYLFAAALVLGICYVLVSTRTKLDRARLVTAATCFAILVPFFLPAMHERYFYLADVLSLVLAFYRPRLWFVPLIVQTSSFLAYLPFLFRTGPLGPLVDPRLLATLMLVALVVTTYSLLYDVRNKAVAVRQVRAGLDQFDEPRAERDAVGSLT